MSRALAFVALIALAHPASAQEPSFKSTSSELVVLPVLVTDRPDHYVPDLAREQFTVYDNGRRVPLEFFSAEDTPVTVGLVIDSSSSMRHKLGDVIAGASAFARASNEDDEFFALSFNDEVREVTPAGAFLAAHDQPALNRAFASLLAEGRTSMYDALIEGLNRLKGGTRPRHALVLVSDGGDNASSADLERVLAAARSSNAAIYTIGIFDEFDLEKNPKVLKALASATGGERFLPRSAGALVQTCLQVAREIRQGYTLAYEPPDRDGAFHRIRVEATGTGGRKLNVRTRPGYFAARETADRSEETARRSGQPK
ncbi:MAG TPA: VWA domain-containing protein [Vicinamibacterales bacterium]|jgi:VWFA-related protein